MNEIQKDLEKYKDTMKIGACIQFETYLEFVDIALGTFKSKIEENSQLFDNDIPYRDFYNQLDSLQDQISFFTMLVQKELENKNFNSCDYFIKYHN